MTECHHGAGLPAAHPVVGGDSHLCASCFDEGLAESVHKWRRAGGAPDVEVAIDPAELEGLDEEGVRALYDERLAQQQSTASRGDLPFAYHLSATAVLLSGARQSCCMLHSCAIVYAFLEDYPLSTHLLRQR